MEAQLEGRVWEVGRGRTDPRGRVSDSRPVWCRYAGWAGEQQSSGTWNMETWLMSGGRSLCT